MPSPLKKMTATAFATYLDQAIADYARDNVESGRWPAEGALERSRADHQKLLPQGLDTPDQHLFEITHPGTGDTVGMVWLAVDSAYSSGSAFIYDIEVQARFRRQGHARRALEELEAMARNWGKRSIGLHVFRQNTGAQALYAALGYQTVSSNMVKALD